MKQQKWRPMIDGNMGCFTLIYLQNVRTQGIQTQKHCLQALYCQKLYLQIGTMHPYLHTYPTKQKHTKKRKHICGLWMFAYSQNCMLFFCVCAFELNLFFFSLFCDDNTKNVGKYITYKKITPPSITKIKTIYRANSHNQMF